MILTHTGKIILQQAVRRESDLDTVEYLIENDIDINANNDYAVQIASEEGRLNIVKLLVSNGANIHANNDYALRCASENGHFEIVKFLVDQGADIHANDDNALQSACSGGYLDIVKFLVTLGANIHAFDDFAIYTASWNCHLDIVKFLVSHGADVDIAIEFISRYSHLDMEKYLAAQCTNTHDDYTVQCARHLDIIKFLIARNADLSKISHDQVVVLSEDKNFISEIINKGYCLDMTLENNLIIEKVREKLMYDIDTVLNRYDILIPNIREQIIYSYM